MVRAIVQAVRDTVTIKVRPAAGIGYFVTEQGRTGITAMDGAGTAGTGVGAGTEEIIITGIGVVDVDTETKTVTFIVGTHVAIGSTLGACCLVAW